METIFTTSRLEMKGLNFQARLGCTQEERNNPQSIKVDFTIEFLGIPSACKDDNLQNTVCYADLADIIRDVIARSEYALIEKLAFEIHRAISAKLHHDCTITVGVTKLHPPISHINDGVRFELKCEQQRRTCGV